MMINDDQEEEEVHRKENMILIIQFFVVFIFVFSIIVDLFVCVTFGRSRFSHK